MILTAIAVAIAVLVLVRFSAVPRAFYRNLSAARQSGIPHVITPIFIRDIWWLISQDYLLPVLYRLPQSWTQSWLPLVMMRRVWHQGYAPFARIGSDTFLAVSSSGNVLWTCDPDVIGQVSGKRGGFHKPVAMLGMLNVYGPTVTATDGEESRLYRKIAAPSFNDTTHAKVWRCSLDEAEIVLGRWMARMADSADGILLQDDVARMTLHVLSYCSYGRKMDWVDEHGRQGVVPPGHRMSYTEAMSSMLARLPIIFLNPPSFLRSSPKKVHKEAHESYQEAKKYMEEMREEKQAELRLANGKHDPNLLDALVHSSEYPGRKANALANNVDAHISPEAVLGNIFIFILAGHETNANTTIFALTMLACYPKIQRQVQEDIDRILEDRYPRDWTYDKDFPRLLDGYPGAVMNEIIRLYTVLPMLPKSTGATPTMINVNGKQCAIAPETPIFINTSATHRNPKYWGKQAKPELKSGEVSPYPVSSFNPQQWIDGFAPVYGSFVPFGEGARACMGQRFAKTGFIAVLCRMLKFHSVELAVQRDDRDAWLRAKAAAEREMSDGVDFTLALKMSKGVPLRFVKRGLERWPDA